jgi:hypothetical protein
VAVVKCASVEAEERGWAEELGKFPSGPPGLTDPMIYCDMTVSPDGLPVSVESRINEILNRYGVDSLVGRFISRASPKLRAASGRVEARLIAALGYAAASPLGWRRSLVV